MRAAPRSRAGSGCGCKASATTAASIKAFGLDVVTRPVRAAARRRRAGAALLHDEPGGGVGLARGVAATAVRRHDLRQECTRYLLVPERNQQSDLHHGHLDFLFSLWGPVLNEIVWKCPA